MAVRKIDGRWWVDFRHNFIRYRKKSPLNTRDGALEYEATLRGRLARGEPLFVEPKTSEPTFGEFVSEWFDAYVRAKNNKPSEVRSKEMILRVHLLPVFGAHRLSAIGTELIERYLAAKAKSGLSPKTVNNQLSVLMTCLRSAAKWKRIAEPPSADPLRTEPPDFDYLSPTEVEQLLQNHDEPVFNIMAHLAVRTGLRLGELRALDWRSVDLPRRQLTVRQSLVREDLVSPKSNRIRHVPLAADAVGALLSIAGRRVGPVFTLVDGRPLTFARAEKGLRRLCRRAGMRAIGWHALRHTFASQLAIGGVPVPVIQNLLGHASIVTTMRYAHLSPAGTAQVVGPELLDRAFETAPTPWRGQPAGISAPANVPVPAAV